MGSDSKDDSDTPARIGYNFALGKLDTNMGVQGLIKGMVKISMSVTIKSKKSVHIDVDEDKFNELASLELGAKAYSYVKLTLPEELNENGNFSLNFFFSGVSLEVIFKAKLSYLLLVTIFFSHCAQSQANNNSNEPEKNSVIKEYYIVFKYSMPFEVQINGMVTEKETESGLNGAVNLNQFILKDGVQHIKIKISHPFIKKGGTIKPDELKSLEAGIYVATKNESGKTKLLKSILFPERLKNLFPISNTNGSLKQLYLSL